MRETATGSSIHTGSCMKLKGFNVGGKALARSSRIDPHGPEGIVEANRGGRKFKGGRDNTWLQDSEAFLIFVA